MPTDNFPKTEITLRFSVSDLAQLEAFATLHGQSVEAFVQRAALDAAHIAVQKHPANADVWWMQAAETAYESEPVPEIFAPIPTETRPTPDEIDASTPVVKRGVAGEPSQLARGSGLVWEIRRALGQERVHGLGWTREHLAFVLKLSVVGVRKMERLGTIPVKSLEARRALLKLAQTLERPTAEIAAYIGAESAEIGSP